MRLLSLLLLSFLCGPAMAESTESRNEVFEQFKALPQHKQQEILGQVNERLQAEQPSCGGKVGRLRCAIEKLTGAEWLFVFGIVGAICFMRTVYNAFITERRTQQSRDSHWLMNKIRRKPG